MYMFINEALPHSSWKMAVWNRKHLALSPKLLMNDVMADAYILWLAMWMLLYSVVSKITMGSELKMAVKNRK